MLTDRADEVGKNNGHCMEYELQFFVQSIASLTHPHGHYAIGEHQQYEGGGVSEERTC